MLQKLQTFLYVAELQSVSLAAKKSLLTQPALTHHIRALEKHFGKKLLQRVGNHMQLTAEGAKLYEASWPLFEQLKKVEQVFAQQEEELVLQFSTIDSVIDSILPKSISKLKVKQPNISFNMQVCASQIAFGMLLEEKIAFALCTIDNLPKGLCAEKLFAEELIFIGSEKHCNVKDVQKIQQENFILFPQHSMTRRLVDQALQHFKIHPNILLEHIKTSTIVSFVENDLGISLVPRYSVYKDLRAKRIFEIPIKTGVRRTVGIVYREKTVFSNIALAFFDILKKEALKSF